MKVEPMQCSYGWSRTTVEGLANLRLSPRPRNSCILRSSVPVIHPLQVVHADGIEIGYQQYGYKKQRDI